jgi:pyruvate-formate lyase
MLATVTILLHLRQENSWMAANCRVVSRERRLRFHQGVQTCFAVFVALLGTGRAAATSCCSSRSAPLAHARHWWYDR